MFFVFYNDDWMNYEVGCQEFESKDKALEFINERNDRYKNEKNCHHKYVLIEGKIIKLTTKIVQIEKVMEE